jgi:uncharacterized membrane protein
MKKFFKEHSKYFTDAYTTCFVIFCITSGLGLLVDIVEAGNNGQVGTAILLIVFAEVLIPLRALIATLISGTAISIIGFIPHLIFRKKDAGDDL